MRTQRQRVIVRITTGVVLGLVLAFALQAQASGDAFARIGA
jgi:hypothetical protein